MGESQNDRLARKIEASKQRAAQSASAPVGNGVYVGKDGRYFTAVPVRSVTKKPCGCLSGFFCTKCHP